MNRRLALIASVALIAGLSGAVAGRLTAPSPNYDVTVTSFADGRPDIVQVDGHIIDPRAFDNAGHFVGGIDNDRLANADTNSDR
jgi:hypothetical protein